MLANPPIIIIIIIIFLPFLNSVMGVFLQEGFRRLWRGTNAGLALAVPTVSFSMDSILISCELLGFDDTVD